MRLVYRCAPVDVVREYLHPGDVVVTLRGAEEAFEGPVVLEGRRFRLGHWRRIADVGPHHAVIPGRLRGHENVALLALAAGAETVEVGGVVRRPLAVLALLVASWASCVLSPVFAVEALVRVALLLPRRRVVSLSGEANDWLSHLTYAQLGYDEPSSTWLGSYRWSRAYPPLGIILLRAFGVPGLTLLAWAVFLGGCLGVGHGWAGLVGAVVAASSIPLRDSLLRAGRPEVFGWGLALCGLALPQTFGAGALAGAACWVHPVPWAAMLLPLAVQHGPFSALVAFAIGAAWAAPWAADHLGGFQRTRARSPMTSTGFLQPGSVRLALLAWALWATQWSPWALAAVCLVSWWPMLHCDPMRSTVRPLAVDKYVAIWRTAVEALGPGAVLAFEPDPWATVGIHHQWLASYALASIGTQMLGGAGFDHASPELVRAADEEDFSGRGITHLVVHSEKRRAAMGPADVEVTLPPLGLFPARRLSFVRVG